MLHSLKYLIYYIIYDLEWVGFSRNYLRVIRPKIDYFINHGALCNLTLRLSKGV